MQETVQTRTHAICAAGDCERTNRQARDTEARWVKVLGIVYASERRTLVVHSWAEGCPEHAEDVAAAVTGDIEEWAERWSVETHTSDYAQDGPATVTTTASGDGTPKEWAQF